jgi:acyl-ACP thioesterase
MESYLLRTQYTVTTAESDMEGRLKPGALVNFLVQSAISSAEKLGFGFNILQDQQLFWVLHRLSVQILKTAGWNNILTVETWPKTIDGLLYLRDFMVFDENREVVARATSGWLAVNRSTKRPGKVSTLHPEKFSSLKDRHAICELPEKITWEAHENMKFRDGSERLINTESGGWKPEDKKHMPTDSGSQGPISTYDDHPLNQGGSLRQMTADRATPLKAESNADHGAKAFRDENSSAQTQPDCLLDISENLLINPVWSDFDINHHVTSSRYIDWMTDTLTWDLQKTCYPVRLSVSFLKEILPGDVIRMKHWYTGDVHCFDAVKEGSDAPAFRGKFVMGERGNK